MTFTSFRPKITISESIDTQEVVSTCRLRIAARRRFKMFRVTVVQSDRFTPQETHLEEFIPALCRCANERQKLGPSRGVWTNANIILVNLDLLDW